MSQSSNEDDISETFKNDRQEEKRYRNRPLFKTWRFLDTGRVKFVELENQDSSWIETAGENVVSLVEER